MPRNGPKKTAAREVVDFIVKQNPEAGARTIARMVMAEHGDLFTSLEQCRDMVRCQLGIHGEHARKLAIDKTMFREPRKAGERWQDVIPEALVQVEGWGPFQIAGKQQTAVLSDIHLPFHSPMALEVTLNWIAAKNPTCILINGDGADHYSCSRWVTDPSLRDFELEIQRVTHFLKGLRKEWPKARIVYKWGNHEERYVIWLRTQAPNMISVPNFQWEAIFETEKYKVEVVKWKRPVRLGKINVFHGHEYPFAISNPVNPARGLFLRAKVHAMCGHFHQSANHSEKNAEEKVISTWSLGCLCDMHPEFRPLNNWNHGFAWVEHDDTDFQVENFKIIDGKVFHT